MEGDSTSALRIFRPMNTRIKLLVVSAALFLTVCAFTFAFAQNSEPSKKEILVGRILADVPRLTHGAGIGPLWQDFIFGVESKNGRYKIKPVLIAYAFHNFKSDGPLRDAFFDHSKLYELHVRREPHCDESVATLSVVKNETVEGEPLPPSPGISFIDGAPNNVLEPEMVLPCYVLYRGDYRVK